MTTSTTPVGARSPLHPRRRTEPGRITVCGGTIAALVAADALAFRGRDVDLMLPDRNVGVGFQHLEFEGYRLEFGSRHFELAFEDPGPVPSFDAYRPGRRGFRPYAPLIERYLKELLGDRLRPVSDPKIFFGGRFHDDIIHRVDLSKLSEMVTASQARAIRDETARIMANGSGDAGLMAEERRAELWRLTLGQASLANHGPTFHGLFIDAISRKVDARGPDLAVAALRRKIWMPLFWPRTLWEAASGRPVSFRPHRPYHAGEPGGSGRFVVALLARLEASPRVRVQRLGRLERLAGRGDEMRLGFARGETLCREPVLGISPEECFAAAGAPYEADRVRGALAWAEIDESELGSLPSVAWVADSDVPAYRITNGGPGRAPGSRLVILELQSDVDSERAEAAVRTTLEKTGILAPEAPYRLVHFLSGPSFSVPSFDNWKRFERSRRAFEARFGRASIVGPAREFCADQLAEQIVQGLLVAEERAGC